MTISLDKTTLTAITIPNFTFSQETITASTDTSEGDEDFEEIMLRLDEPIAPDIGPLFGRIRVVLSE